MPTPQRSWRLPTAWALTGLAAGVGMTLLNGLGGVLVLLALVSGGVLVWRSRARGTWAGWAAGTGSVALLLIVDTLRYGSCPTNEANIYVRPGGEQQAGFTSCQEVVASHWSMATLAASAAVVAALWPWLSKRRAAAIARTDARHQQAEQTPAS